MGGVAKTVSLGIANTKKVLSGKGNIGDIGNIALGNTTFNKPKDAPGPDLSTSPAQSLAQSGGAPLLANIAMGVDPKDAIASYFGQSNFDEWYNGKPAGPRGTDVVNGMVTQDPGTPGLGEDEKKLIDGVLNQLTTIQKNTNLRNQAVQQVVNDFPNIAAQAAQARQASGGEFDEATKGAMNLALNQGAAKYAANGGLSSGAMNEAMAKMGAQYGMDKLNYMDNRGDTAYNQGVQGWQVRYNETNALRNFQNLMMGQAAGNGFSAQQATLARNNQNQLTQLGYINQNNQLASAQENAMYTGLGSLAGTAVGAYFGGPAGAAAGNKIGAQAGSSLGGNTSSPSFPQGSPNMNNPLYTPRLNSGGF